MVHGLSPLALSNVQFHPDVESSAVGCRPVEVYADEIEEQVYRHRQDGVEAVGVQLTLGGHTFAQLFRSTEEQSSILRYLLLVAELLVGVRLAV